jgi:hypothetical protein
MTVVSSAKPERSKVVPDGTATSERTMVAHADCDLEASAAPLEPEKVQLEARLTTSGLGAEVMAGAGAATADAASDLKKIPSVKATIAKNA